jgi:hypothetical protein
MKFLPADSRRRVWLLALPGAMLLSGCESVFGIGGDCVDIGVPALAITVVDATTKAAPSTAATVRVSEGDWVENPTADPSLAPPRFYAAYERTGTYTVLVRAPGYEDLTQGNLSVGRTGGTCNSIKTVAFTAQLKRIP